ncbi:MAG: lysine--tRNA ligase [Anaerolineae bacterium]
MEKLSDLERQRRLKLNRILEKGVDPYPARAERTHTTAEAINAFESGEGTSGERVSLAGRVVSVRVMGKSTFAHIADGSGRIQINLRHDTLGGEKYDHFRRDFDIGDFISAVGTLFQTRTGEITLQVEDFTMLAKSLRPLPEKWHGLRDVETRYRQRYLDLIANEKVRHIFTTRSRIVTAMRHFLDSRGFLEVETPVLQPLYGGATARPFVTHHHTLDQTLYLRISDELYLKRLIVGGYERVYEISKDFRNEGISTRNNPEFTMMECYQAYADYNDIMVLVEEMMAAIAQEVLGSLHLVYQGHEIDLTPPWRRLTLRQSILDETGIDIEAHPDLQTLQAKVEEIELAVETQPTWAKLVDELLSEYVQPKLVQPTFIIDYPVELSPLAKKKPEAPHLVERFEPFVGGLELGNAFSELNDPLDQRARFVELAKAREAGDEEVHPVDEDYVAALEYGMPPTGGLGIGVDRLVMLFTDQQSIREVILFPQLRTVE